MTPHRRAFSSCSSPRLAPGIVPPPPPSPPQEQRYSAPGKAASCHRSPPTSGPSGGSPPKQSRRRNGGARASWATTLRSLIFALAFAILFCCPAVVAADHVLVAPRMVERGELLFDRSEPPFQPPMRLPPRHEKADAATQLPSIVPAPSQELGSSTVTSTVTKTRSPLQTASMPSDTSLPRPFDSSLGNNFTAPSCPAFFQSFLNNATFEACLPFSLLLQNSNAFFIATRSPAALSRILQATCNVDVGECTALMSSLADQIQEQANCGADLALQNPTVAQALAGFAAYAPLYHAGCLTDTATGSFCYTDATDNASAPTSSQIYYLPLGLSLPGGSAPACNRCLRKTMGVFANYAENGSHPLSDDYEAAAQQVDILCGPRYVQVDIRMSGAALGRVDVGVSGTVVLLVTFGLLGFLL